MKEWIVILIWAIAEKVAGAEKARAFAVWALGEERVIEIENSEGMFG